ncbi:hypothetical protein ACHAXT_007581 [Thalassiosira profunda]
MFTRQRNAGRRQPGNAAQKRMGTKLAAFRRLFTLATLLKICAISAYLGYRNAVANESESRNAAAGGGGCTVDISPALQRQIDARVKEELVRRPTGGHAGGGGNGGGGKLFPDSAKDYAQGAVRVARDELMERYDFGVPIKEAAGIDAVILYNHHRSLPSNSHAATHGEAGELAKLSVPDAMANCDTMNVVFTALQDRPQVPECQLLIPSFESYHINRWLRIPKFDKTNRKERQLNHALPLRHHGRITLPKNGIDEFDLPPLWDNMKKKEKGFLMKHFDALKIFLENVDDVLKDLEALLKKRNAVRDNTVVVMTVNSGQSELLSNFVCNAKSRGLDISNVLVFPTDEESHNLAQGLGLATYFDAKSLGVLPSGEAKMYGDPIFASMMYAKVLCVLYVSLLGHDVLFQDVDVVWFKDPLEYFHDTSNKDIQQFDILFQHDGSAQPRYNPLSANSGFYYVRANKKSQYLFTSLLYHGAVVRKSKSHQQVLVQLLNEHSSLFGLKVKVFDKHTTDMFPGGYHYHLDWDAMRNIVDGKSNAFILHMSWTENKTNKLLFFRQMEEWYLKDQCIGYGEVLTLFDGGVVKDGGLIDKCCSAEAIFSCHFKDKPSKRPCPDSPRIDPHKQRTFWK